MQTNHNDEPRTMENDQTIVDFQSHNHNDDNSSPRNGSTPSIINGMMAHRKATVKDDFSDIISATIRNRTKGVALCSALSLASSMALLSVSLAVSYTLHHYNSSSENSIMGNVDNRQLLSQQHAVDNTTTSTSLSCIASIMTNTSSSELWAQLLTLQIDLLQNLIHASLLGGAAIVAAYRGDVLWLYFVRNCSFYFGLTSISYFVVDCFSFMELYKTTTTANGITNTATTSPLVMMLHNTELVQLGLRLLLTSLFVLSAVAAYCCLDAIVRRVRKLQHQHFRTVVTLPTSNSRADCSSFPPYMAETPSDFQRASVIYYSSWIIQLISILYRVWTTWQALDDNQRSLQCGQNTTTMDVSSPSSQHSPVESLLSFEMAYSIGAHEGYLLAILMLPGMFPRNFSSVGGCILASVWRLVLALGSTFHLVWHWKNDKRDLYSAIFTGLELLSLIPILISVLLLATNFQSHLSFLAPMRRESVAYSPLDVSEAEEEDGGDNDHGSSNLSKIDSVTDRPLQQIKIPSLLLISASHRYSRRQGWGAYILWASSSTLLMGMTMEAILLLSLNELGSPRNNNVYKWGMHLCAMYSFCTIMSVSSQEVYRRARMLLSVACPMGSFVALWQLAVLHDSYETQRLDSFLVFCLLSARALSGVGQTIGLNLLAHIDPRRLESSNGQCVDDDEIELRNKLTSAQSLGRTVLFWLYVPSTVAYGFLVALVGNCSQPMISLTTPSSSPCETPMMGFMLAQNWQGIGIAFHFGILTVIFAADGLSTVPFYAPSLAIGSLFAAHLGLLIACDFGWAFGSAWLQNVVPERSLLQWVRVGVLFCWMFSSCFLFVTLHRFWKLRVIEV